MEKKYNIAVVGATGSVGREIIQILEERNFPVRRLSALASARSVGQKLPFRGGEIEVKELREDSFIGTDIALFSAGSSISKKYAPIAVESGCVAIDNSSAWRMEKGVPLIIEQHGGGFGMRKFSFDEEHEIKIADKVLSWGSEDSTNKNIILLSKFPIFTKNSFTINPLK